MRIQFHNIHIQNFYSIKDIEYDFREGITKVLGTNLDNINTEDGASNGAGKSTLFHAVSQCLFNRNMKGKVNIDKTYNKVTKKPYILTLTFMLGDIFYEICNNRILNEITITEDGNNITVKGIKNQLQLIEDILEIDFDTFNILTYLNQKNITNVLDVANSQNIIYKFFDLEKLALLESKARLTLRELKKDFAYVINQEKVINKSLSDYTKFSIEDISEIYTRVQEIENLIINVKSSDVAETIVDLHNKLKVEKDALSTTRTSITEYSTKLKTYEEHKDLLASGTCPTCGNTSTNSKKYDLEDKIEATNKFLWACSKSKQIIEDSIDGINNTITKNKEQIKNTLNTYRDELDRANKQILVAEEKNRNYEKFRKTKEILEQEKYKLKEDKHKVTTELNFINPLLQIIKSGEISQLYISNFTNFFNEKLKEVSSILDIDFEVYAVEDMGSIRFIIEMGNEELEYNLLSSGEQTRVSLIVLITTIVTLEVVTNTSVNFLVFDELLSVLDATGLDVFKILLNTLKTTKNLFIVAHHNEIEDSFFDRTFNVEKKNGLSYINIKDKNGE